MNALKSHSSLILALFAMLFTLETTLMMKRLLEDYKLELAKNYKLIIVSKQEMTLQQFKRISPNIAAAQLISSQEIVKGLKDNLSKAHLALLKVSLPKFYKLSLNHYPSKKKLVKLEQALLKHPFISKVESFATSQNQTYILLNFNKMVMFVFSTLIFFTAFLLMLRQIEVWRFRHKEKISIMNVFGAPTWLRSAVLYQMAVVDSFISTLIAAVCLYYFAKNPFLNDYLAKVGLSSLRFDLVNDSIVMFVLAFIIAIFSVTFVVFRAEEE